ncbi:MAG: hypothetical protein JKX91_06375 [Rhizobiaceae bacterium]|nr:hypothetical protein [Rhizobiaceae bacterium]
MNDVKNINSAACDAAKIEILDNLIYAANTVIKEEGDISVRYSDLVTAYKQIKANEIKLSKGEGS